MSFCDLTHNSSFNVLVIHGMVLFLLTANPQAMQLYGGRMTAARLKEVGSVTKEAIEKLHKYVDSIVICQC